MTIVWHCPICDAHFTGDQHPLATGGWKCPHCDVHFVGGPIEQTNPKDAYVYAKAIPIHEPGTTPGELLWRER